MVDIQLKQLRLNVSKAFYNKTQKHGGKEAFGSSFTPVSMTIHHLIDHIRDGNAFTLGCFQGNTRRKNTFVSSQLLALDLDEGKWTVDELAVDDYIRRYAFLIYPTPSSTPEHPKSRVVFSLENPVTDYQEWESIQRGLMNKFYHLKPDPACKDAARLFFGSDLKGARTSASNYLPLDEMKALAKADSNLSNEPKNKGELPPDFIRAIEGQLQANDYTPDGWSKPMACIFKDHQHDDKSPAASWHKDKHIFKCFKCGEYWLAKETGEMLGIQLADYLPEKQQRLDNDEGDANGYKPTDDELGEMLIERWGGKYKYMYGEWHKYQDGYWSPEERAIRLDFWQVMIDSKKSGIRPTSSKACSVENYLKLKLMIEDREIEQSHRYINLRNGLYDLETFEIVPHKPDLYMTYQLPFEFNEDAVAIRFINFLREVLVDPSTKKPDEDLIALVQEAFGYSLTADTSHRVSFWCVGESGAGKSRLLDVLIDLAGNSHVTIDLDEMSRNSYQIADIAGKRVVTFTEPDSRSVLADSHYKRLVSQDTIMARQIHGKPFRFVPIAKLWGAMNDTPRVVDRSDAVFNRVIILPFNYVVPPHKRDPHLQEKLRAELPGIFNWALVGLRRLQNRGKFTVAQQSQEARDEYKSENDTEMAFINDWCIRDAQAQTPAQLLYDGYKTWCQRNGVMPKSSVKVSKDWRRLGLEKRKSSGIYYQGIELSNHAKKFFSGV